MCQRLQNIYKQINIKIPPLQVGPEKGVTHLATAAIINALWDLWANLQQKPLWKLLVDMEPEKLVSVIDFRYM
jgi:L-fuconate dehydratase